MEFKPDDNLNKLKDVDTALEASRVLNDENYLTAEEARMSGNPEATLRAQENQMRVATTEKEIADLKETLKKALESNN